MRVATIRDERGETPVIDTGDGFRALAVPSLRSAIGDGMRFADLAERAERAPGVPVGEDATLTFAPPVRPGKIVAIGLNYRDHVRETGLPTPERPLVFSKFASSLTGARDPIVVDRRLTQQVDWEVELALVVGQTMRSVGEAAALDGVFGYTVANDVSARDVQFGDGQWTRGKSFDTFCPVGPWLVAPEDVEVQRLGLRTRVNGEVVQESSTAEMIFGVAELLAYCSRSFPLEPGDLVLTGTPWGCGGFMDPPRGLRHGDVVEAEVDGIGLLRNPVVEVESP